MRPPVRNTNTAAAAVPWLPRTQINYILEFGDRALGYLELMFLRELHLDSKKLGSLGASHHPEHGVG